MEIRAWYLDSMNDDEYSEIFEEVMEDLFYGMDMAEWFKYEFKDFDEDEEEELNEYLNGIHEWHILCTEYIGFDPYEAQVFMKKYFKPRKFKAISFEEFLEELDSIIKRFSNK